MTQAEFRQAVHKTLAYAGVFEYPLTVQELYERLVVPHPISFSVFQKKLQDLQGVYVTKKYYYLSGDHSFIRSRVQREKWSRHLWKEVERLKKILQRIPTIEAAYITGSLAVNNVSSAQDDIDVLIITKPSTLWLTRLVVIVWTGVLGKYRLHGATGGGWCFNLWLTPQSLTVEKKRRTLYTAYEIMQAKQIIGEHNWLLMSNGWVHKFLPNVVIPSLRPHSSMLKNVASLTAFLDWVCYGAQYLYMLPRKTIEKVDRQAAFFHPRDTKGMIMKKYQKRLERI